MRARLVAVAVRSDWKAQALGVLLAAGSLVAVVFVAEPLGGVLAFGLAVTGLFLFVVVAERAVPAEAVEAMVRNHAEQLAEIRASFSLTGRPVYVPTPAGSELFLPASDDGNRIPLIDTETRVYTGSAGTRPGLAFTLSEVVDSKVKGAPLELAEAESRLGALAAADLAHGLVLNVEPGGRLKADFRAGACALPCQDSPDTPDCLATGCMVCHAVGGMLAATLQRPVAAHQAEVRGRRITLWFQPAGAESAAPPASAAPVAAAPATTQPFAGEGGVEGAA